MNKRFYFLYGLSACIGLFFGIMIGLYSHYWESVEAPIQTQQWGRVNYYNAREDYMKAQATLKGVLPTPDYNAAQATVNAALLTMTPRP